jgi:citrate synthase
MKKKTAGKTTRISGYDADRITIRGHDLVGELMGKLSFSQMILLQLLGRMPARRQAKVLDAVLVTIMEHGLVPSAIVSRLTLYGAPESYQGAIAAGLLGVGDRFAGTASACGRILEQLVAVPDRQRTAAALEVVISHRETKRPIPGFGHPIHRRGDPRVKRLIAIAKDAGIEGHHLRALGALERAVHKEYGKKLVTNVSAAIAAALGEAGVPANAMRGVVLTARCAGLAGHLHEEMQAPVAETMWRTIEKEIRYEPEE